MTTLPKLTKKDALGHQRFYWGEYTDGMYRTHSQRDARAKSVASAWTLPRPSARRTPTEQCVQELASIYTKRRRMGWTDYAPRTPRLPTLPGDTWYSPMLAQKYPHVQPPASGHYAQPKLDGVRCIGGPEGLTSRKNTMLTSVPLVGQQVFKFLRQHPSIKQLDGELYIHGLDLHEISGLARRKKADFHTNKLEFHVFDCVTNDPYEPFEERVKRLKRLEGFSLLRPVETQWCEDQEDRDFLHAKWIRAGYEGSMYRHPEGTYENKRTKYLLKRKDFIEKEFTVIGIREGNGAWRGCAKAIDYVDHRGEEFDSGIRGTQAYLRTVLRDRHKIIGSSGTVRYFSLTPKRGVPYLPVTVNLGRWDLEDNTLASRHARLTAIVGKKQADKLIIPF